MTHNPLYQRYFSGLAAAIDGLERALVIRDQGPWGARPHDILGAVMIHNLTRLRNAVRAWNLKVQYVDRFQIDLKESGFPVFKTVLELEQAQKQAPQAIKILPTPTELKQKMINQMLTRRQMPKTHQRDMAKRLYYQDLAHKGFENGVFSALTLPRTIRVSTNQDNKRPYYVVYWSIYDGSANLPLIYTLVVEDSSPETDAKRALSRFQSATQPPSGKPVRAGASQGMEGLPNARITQAFSRFVESHSAYSLSLINIAKALDEAFDHLHPKQLRRFILGPFYAGGITLHNEMVQGVLDKVESVDNNWLFTWTMQELLAENEKPGQRRFWGASPPRQIFYINADDVDCVQQGVSAVEYHALVPHEAYQAVYASGEADAVFGRYQCSVMSGHEVIRQI